MKKGKKIKTTKRMKKAADTKNEIRLSVVEKSATIMSFRVSKKMNRDAKKSKYRYT